MPLAGIINLNKPAGITSRQAVDRVERLVRPAKAGHAGTLDPIASGVLLVAVGVGTRLIERVQRQRKRYLGTFQLGCTSPTEDIEGEITPLSDPPVPTLAAIERAAEGFVGPIQQRPPAFSALWVDGRRSYELARQGKAVELASRPINVYGLRVVEYEYPRLVLDIECGAGTYVRSLGRDLAESLGTGAVMTALVRTAIGSFNLEMARDPSQLTRDNVDDWLLPLRRAVQEMPALSLNAGEMDYVLNGRSISQPLPEGAEEVAALDAEGRLVAILVQRKDGIGPNCTFPQSA